MDSAVIGYSPHPKELKNVLGVANVATDELNDVSARGSKRDSLLLIIDIFCSLTDL